MQDEKRMEPQRKGYFRWFWDTLNVPTTVVVTKSGLDGYFCLRYLRLLLRIFLLGIILLWPILMPSTAVNGLGSEGGVVGLDLLTVSNIENKKRLWTHVVMGYIFYPVTIWMIVKELKYFVAIRQITLVNPSHQRKAKATTILVNSIPRKWMNADALRNLFEFYPGAVKRVWLNVNYETLMKKIEERERIHKVLELSELILIKKANKAFRKRENKGILFRSKNTNIELEDRCNKSASINNLAQVSQETKIENNQKDRGIAGKYVSEKERPKMRLPIHGMAGWLKIGEKVDKIDWCRSELVKIDDEIEDIKKRDTGFKLSRSAFIQFDSQLAATIAVQCISHETPLMMHPRNSEVSNTEILWQFANVTWVERVIRVAVISGIVGAMIFFWTFITAFVGLLTNIAYLSRSISWLNWLDRMPAKLFGIITGVLPSAILALQIAFMPSIFQVLTTRQGYMLRSQCELKTQDMYFVFLFIQIFLVVSISSQAFTLADELFHNPTSIAATIANNLPRSSTFYYAYLLMQGLTVTSGNLLQFVRLVAYSIKKVSNSSPRAQWKRDNVMVSISWSSVMPLFVNLGVICLSYSLIAPFILIVGFFVFLIFYFVYLYNMLYVYTFTVDMTGRSFPKAISQTFAGIYVSLLCMIGLCLLKLAIPQAVLFIILIIGVLISQVLTFKNFDSLFVNIPLSARDQQRFDPENESDSENDDIVDTGDTGKEATSVTGIEKTKNGVRKRKKKQFFSGRKHKKTVLRANYTGSSKFLVGASIEPSDLHRMYHAEVDDSEGFHEENEAIMSQAYLNPAMKTRQLVVWLMSDPIGVGEDECRQINECGLQASCKGAWLDKKGKIHVKPGENPPDFKLELDL